MDKQRVIASLQKSLGTFIRVLPIILGMLLLTSLAITLLPGKALTGWFGQQAYLDVLVGASLGSIAAGHPLASYLLGGELLRGGIGLWAVTALIVSWVTVGIVQLPAEMLLLGRRFAVYRNLVCYGLVFAVSFATVHTLQWLSQAAP
jgi:hypothetical protein